MILFLKKFEILKFYKNYCGPRVKIDTLLNKIFKQIHTKMTKYDIKYELPKEKVHVPNVFIKKEDLQLLPDDDY